VIMVQFSLLLRVCDIFSISTALNFERNVLIAVAWGALTQELEIEESGVDRKG